MLSSEITGSKHHHIQFTLHFSFVSVAMVSWCTKLPLLVFPLSSAIPIFTYLTALCILFLQFHLFARCCLGDIVYHVPSHPFQPHIFLECSTVLVCGIIYYCSLVTIVYPVACNQQCIQLLSGTLDSLLCLTRLLFQQATSIFVFVETVQILELILWFSSGVFFWPIYCQGIRYIGLCPSNNFPQNASVWIPILRFELDTCAMCSEHASYWQMTFELRFVYHFMHKQNV